MPRAAVLLLLLFSVAGSACQEGSAGAEGPKGPPPPLVSTAPARSGELTVEVPYLGEVRALARAELAAGAEGEVRRVAVREGDEVARGDLLVEIDPDLAAASVAAAAAVRDRVEREATQAARDAERFSAAGTEAVAATEIERAEATADTLDAERRNRRALLAAARETRRRHDIRAPFPGVVAARRVDPGAWVGVGDPVIELVARGGAEVLVEVPPEVAALLEVGDPAEVRPTSSSPLGPGPGASTPARVSGIVPALDPATRTVTVRLSLEAPPEEPVADAATPPPPLPGSSVDAVLTIVRREPGAVVVPRDALVRGAVETRVVRLDPESQAVLVPVVVLAEAAEELLVTAEGLSPGTELVVRGNERLRPGQRVRVVAGAPEEDTGGAGS